MARIKYSDELADRICGLIAEDPRNTMRAIAAMDGMPSVASICKWLGMHEYFKEQYTRAKSTQADVLVDEMLSIADDGRLDRTTRTGRNGEEYETTDPEVIQRSKLMIDTRKWLAGKLRPKKYSDRMKLEHMGEDGGPVKASLTVNFVKVGSNERNIGATEVCERLKEEDGEPSF